MKKNRTLAFPTGVCPTMGAVATLVEEELA